MQFQSTTQANESTATINGATVGPHGEQIQRTLKDWWAAGTALLWVPIIDVDGTPDSVAAGRELAAELDGGWLIHRPADLLTLPEGLEGWLLPLNADDTNVVCGRWRTEITFMQITDRHTGAVATFQSTVAQTERNEVVK